MNRTGAFSAVTLAARADGAAELTPSDRLKAGVVAPSLALRTILGQEVSVPDPASRLIHLQFLRFANCPVCNLHLQAYIKRIGELRAAGVREVVLFHSEPRHLADYQAHFPFDVVADPHKILFRKYRIERSLFAVLHPKAWPQLITGYRLRPSTIPDSSTFGLPADFLIDRDGRIVDCHYGAHAADQWAVDTVLSLAEASRR